LVTNSEKMPLFRAMRKKLKKKDYFSIFNCTNLSWTSMGMSGKKFINFDYMD